jgi:hypothetical protein
LCLVLAATPDTGRYAMGRLATPDTGRYAMGRLLTACQLSTTTGAPRSASHLSPRRAARSTALTTHHCMRDRNALRLCTLVSCAGGDP